MLFTPCSHLIHLLLLLVFAYIGLLRHHFQMGYTNDEGNKVKGLPTWIYNELKSIAALSYAYEDEGDVTDIVEDLSGEIFNNLSKWFHK